MARTHISNLLPLTITIGPSSEQCNTIDWGVVAGEGEHAESVSNGGWRGAGPRIIGERPSPTVGQWLALAQRHAADFGFQGRIPWSRAAVKPNGYATGDCCHNGIVITFSA